MVRPNTKIVMTLLVRNEEDILRENIEFHLAQGVSFFIATDNLSTDGTAGILKEYEGRGVLRYFFEDSDCYYQSQWVSRMAALALTEYGADWVINNDADEFWWPSSGSLPDAFRKIPRRINILEAARSNFVMVESAGVPFYKRMIYKEAVSLNDLGQPLPSKVAHRGNARIKVGPGNHTVSGFRKVRMRRAAIDILHFPMRSYTHFLSKINLGGAAYERNATVHRKIGATWRKLYSELQKGNGLHEYFDRHTYDNERIQEELGQGRIIEDSRLREYLSGLSGLQQS